MSRILLAEDDETLRNALSLTLESEGYEVDACIDGAEALARFAKARPDLLILDVMMPGASGFDVCREVRKTDETVPVIFLTAKSGEEDVVEGLGLGADDFVAKPFRIRELLARVAAALRRGGPRRLGAAGQPADTPFKIGAALIDPKKFTVEADGEAYPLTARELDLLRELVSRAGEVVSRADLIDEVWGLDYGGGTRTIDQHILQLRKKLGSSGRLIESVRRVGYRLVPHQQTPQCGNEDKMV
ncbi:MAG: response regulator transcription factor [Kiritimatiellae bacterium]|nr:response regulator transcription factor [Kiritimatiellia bacterium]